MKNHAHGNNPLVIPRIILTVSIIAISVVSFYFITTTSNSLLLSSYLSKITSNQRTLCNQLINSIAADNIGGKLNGPPIEKTLENFVKSEALFSKTDSVFKARMANQNIHTNYDDLNDAYDSLLNMISVNLSTDSTKQFVGLLNSENNYLRSLDSYVSGLNSYSNAEVQTFKLREITILLASLLVVFLEIILLFLPSIKKIRKQNEQLINTTTELEESHKLLQAQVQEVKEKNELLKKIAHLQSHEIRQPLTVIMGLVNLLREGHVADENWVNMMSDATTALDKHIQSVVQESNTDNELKVTHYDKMLEEVGEYAIVLLDVNGFIENWNKGMEKVFGYKDFEVIGKNFSMFYTNQDRLKNHIYQLLDRAADASFVRDESWQLKKDGSKFWAGLLITAIHDQRNDVAGYTIVLKDLTDAGTKNNVKNII